MSSDFTSISTNLTLDQFTPEQQAERDAAVLSASMRCARDAEEVERFRAMLREVSP